MSLVKPFLAVFFVLFSLCSALYQDQAGLWDWKQSYVGKITHAWPLLSTQSLLVASEDGVLAHLNLRNGSMNWRRVMETKNGLQAIETIVHDSRLAETITITANGEYMRSWDSNNGLLNWEKRLPDTLLGDEVLYNLNQAQLTAAQLKNGMLDIYEFDHIKDREFLVKSIKYPFKEENIRKICAFVTNQNVVCVQEKSLIHFQTGSNEFTSTSLESLFGSPVDNEQLKIIPLSHKMLKAPLFALQTPQSCITVIGISSSGLKVKKRLPNAEAITLEQYEKTPGQSELGLFAIEYFPGSEVRVFNVETFVEQTDLKEVFEFGKLSEVRIEKLFILPLIKVGSKFTYKVFVSCLDASFSLVSSPKSNLSWTREESLASILAADIVDLPLSDLDENIESALDNLDSDVWNQFTKRVSFQVDQLQTYLQESVTKLADFFSSPSFTKLRKNSYGIKDVNSLEYAKPLVTTQEKLMRDKFGFQKVIIALTKHGKLLGIDTISGKLIWTLWDDVLHESIVDYLNNQKAYHFLKQAKKVSLFVQRGTSLHPFQAVASIVLQNGFIFSFDPIHGQILEKYHHTSPIKQAHLMSHLNKHNMKAILLLDVNNQIHTYPSYVYKETLLNHKEKYYMCTVDANTGLVEGFSLKNLSGQQRTALRVWSFNIPVKDAQTNYMQVLFKSHGEHVHSLGRVLGDRNVLYKYLNPNLVAIINEDSDEQDPNNGESINSNGRSINVYLLDAVAGHLLYSVQHNKAKNAYAVHSENTLVYSFYNEKARRTELNSIEMFEGATMANFTAFSSLERPANSAIIKHNSFIFPTGVCAMADTHTEQGLTNKHLLIALPYGGILQLPKVFVDPRRPLMLTPEQNEEGLLPYTPELPIPAEGIINYNQSVVNVNGIVSAPATIESTSLVFVHGLDLFYTRVAPSKTFDILKEDFEHWFIVAVLMLLFTLYYVSKYLANRKTLYAAWK